jgi:hypothetical protein
MTTLRHSVGAYDVELEVYSDSTQCQVTRGQYHASLACLLGEGKLFNHLDDEHTVPDAVIDEIEAWALLNGY